MRGILSFGYILGKLFREKARLKNAEIEVTRQKEIEKELQKQDAIEAKKAYYDRYAEQYTKK